jgi:hypothetical protein
VRQIDERIAGLEEKLRQLKARQARVDNRPWSAPCVRPTAQAAGSACFALDNEIFSSETLCRKGVSSYTGSM